jgi:hypothetical protein
MRTATRPKTSTPRSSTRRCSRSMERPTGDEYVLDTPVVRAFISAVRASIGAAGSPERACSAIRPHFAGLLADRAWAPGRVPPERA